MHTTKTKSRCWLLSFAEAPGSGDRWQMDRLENPKRFVMTLRWPSFEEVSIYFRRENIFVGSVHNKENILKLEWRVLVGESVAQQQNMKYIYMNICCLWYISSCFIHLWRRELLSYPRECGLSFWPLGAWFSFRFGVSLGPPRAIILWRSVSQDFYGINQSINQHLGSIGFLGYKSIIIIESPRV